MCQLRYYSYLLFEVIPGCRRKFVYVGEGSENSSNGYSRIKTYSHLHRVKNGSLGRRALELAKLGGRLIPVILKRFPTKVGAAEHEKRIVHKCFEKGIPLLNDKEGGLNCQQFTAATILHLREVHRVPLPESAKLKLSRYWSGKKKTASHCAAISRSKLGKRHSASTKVKLRQALVGRRVGWVLTEDEAIDLEVWLGAKLVQQPGGEFLLTRAEKRHVQKYRLGLPTARRRTLQQSWLT